MKQLEPRNTEMQDGLEARIHDPLWFLTRQWQTGEFKGDDAGSPVGAQLTWESCPIARYRPGPASVAGKAKDYSAAKFPLETLVERESPDAGINLRLAAQAGLHFSRLLKLAGLAKYCSAFLGAFPVSSPSAAEPQSLDAATLSYWAVIAKRVIDGARLYAKLSKLRGDNQTITLPAEPPFSAVELTDRPVMIGAVTRWLNWYENLFSKPQAEETSWVKSRMEYAFAVSANTSRGELAMTAPEYGGGGLDWYYFDVDGAQSLGATGPAIVTQSAFLPSPVSFRGMPANRSWEIEDGSVNLANVQAKASDLARPLLIAFALEFGNDWFLVPIEMDVGSVSLVRSLVVTNTFGEKFLLQHTTAVDGPNPTWRMFGLSSAQKDGDSKFKDAFFLPPVLGLGLEGAPIEDVLLLRDEMANMAWAVERKVESPTGQRLDRVEEFARRKQSEMAAQPDGRQPTTSKAPAYRLATSVPDYWIPFLPVQVAESVQLKRGALPGAQPGGALRPLGRILDLGDQLLLHDEEVPREGAHVTRSYQYARWLNGSTQLWACRCKQPGRGEGSSGLQFDILDTGATRS